MNIKDHEPGTPIWVDLQSPDPAIAAQFYAAVLGWQYGEPAPPPDQYRTALLRGRPAAGIGPIRGSDGPGWVTYIAVADIDDTARRIVAAGGTILSPPSGASDGGREGTFVDPSGTRLAAWQTGHSKDAGVADGPGAFCWGELISDDIDASAAFYGSVFGWTATDPEGPLQRREWRLNGRSISGLLPRPPAMAKGIPPYWDVYFTVADVAETAETIIGAGGTQLMPPTDIGARRIAVFLDPVGAIFTVTAPAR
jgi:predicted enzyme related to lactoylglutathione lyase